MRRVVIGAALGGAAALAAVLPCASAAAAEPEVAASAAPQTGPPSAPAGRIELRRQNSERGSEEESTRTTLRVETFLKGTVSRLRLDVPFPDEKSDFSGSPFSPRLGDIKLRAYFRAFQVAATRLSGDIEMSFPTADLPSGGAGKLQLGAALHSVAGAPDFILASGRHQLRVEWSLRQTVSIGGDADRKDINTTKPELALRDTIAGGNWLKLTFKPVIDWVQDGRTGADLELEAGWNRSGGWRFSLMGGASLWGEDTAGVYGRRLEMVAGRSF